MLGVGAMVLNKNKPDRIFTKIRISVFTKIFLISFISAVITLSFITILIYWIFAEFRNYSFFSFFFSEENIFDDYFNLVLVILFVALLLSCCYLSIRQILKPLTTIHRGVIELSKGNLNFRLTKRNNDELGDIIQSFNQMSKKISSLIESKKQLLLNLSHEIKTPITRAKLSLELLKKNQHTANIQEDLKEIELMANSILEAEKLEHDNYLTKTEPVYLEPIIQEVIHSHRLSAIPLKYKNSIPHKKYPLNSLALKILLNNLIKNALNYSYSKTPILIESKLNKNNGSLQISVQDFGIGIAKQERVKVFEAFYRIEKSRSKKYGGCGLGLNICKKIAESHKGKIFIADKPVKGTKIIVIFPKNC